MSAHLEATLIFGLAFVLGLLLAAVIDAGVRWRAWRREVQACRHLLRRIAERQLRISLPTDEEVSAPVESKLHLPDDLREELEREEEERREEEAAEERERELKGT
jgi:hypothetical protein